MADGTLSGGLVRLSLTSDGTSVGGKVKIVAVSTIRALDRVPRAQITVQDGDPAQQDFKVSASATFAPGTKIVISAGYEAAETPLFTGIVTRQRLAAGRGGDTFLHVDLKDPVVAATVARTSRVTTEASEADAIRAALESPGVTVDMEDGDVQGQIVQARATGWDFALARARSLGLAIACDGGTVKIAAPDPSQAPAAKLSFGQGIFSFDLEIDAEAPLAEAIVTGWSSAEQEVSRSDATDPATAVSGLAEVLSGKDTLHVPGDRAAATLDARAAARLMRRAQAGLRGTIEVQGNADVAPGDVVELAGFGSRFATNVLVGGVRHEIGRGDWLTTYELGLPLSASSRAAEPEIPPLRGLELATVEALEDPDGEDRILVSLHSAPDIALRARLTTPEAGDGRGLVMRPAIGDEVVVAFLGDDPRDPVVLGALHSAAHPAPVPGDDENAVKAYVSAKESRLEFDDARPAITLSTAGGAALVFDDEAGTVSLSDQNGNTIEMSSDGIALTSASALTLDAGSDLSGKANAGLTMEASASATLKGSASVNVESGGTCVVKGALVQIN